MPKIVLFAMLAATVAAGGIILASSGHGPSQAVLRDGGDARLVGFQPLPQLEGPMCDTETPLMAAMTEQQQILPRTAAAPAAADSAIAKRPAARIMRDPSAAFSGV